MKDLFKKIFFIVPYKLKSKISFFLIINFLTIVFEMLGLFLIIPLISLILSPDILGKNFFLDFIYFNLSNPTQKEMIIAICIIIIFVFLIKNILLAYFIWWQTNFAHKIQLLISTSLFQIYIYKNYLFHVENNSTTLIRNTGFESNNVRTSILALMTLITEIFLIIGIVFVLIYHNPIINIFVITSFVFFSYLFYFLTKNIISEWGKRRLSKQAITLKGLSQGFHGIKDIKVFNRENFFLNFYFKHLSELVKMNILNGFIKGMPKLFLELLGVIVLVSLMTILFFNENFSSEQVVTSLSLFAVGIIKILPSVGKILSSVQVIKYNNPSIDLIYNEFKNNSLDRKNDIKKINENINYSSDKNHLNIENLNFKYHSESKGLNEVNLDAKENEIVGIIGESGSGKSTLINLMLGLMKPLSGNIRMNDLDIHKNLNNWKDIIGYIPQNIYLTDDTILRNIGFGIEDNKIDNKKIEKCIELAELSSFIKNLPQGLNTVVGERGIKISGGELQRIGIARALYKDPKILILDEATSALDVDTEKNILETISSLKSNKIIIIVSHRNSIFDFCKKIYEIKNGYVRQK